MNSAHNAITGVGKDPESDRNSENVNPPVTFEEFLAINRLTDWPQKVGDEKLLKDFDVESEEKILEMLKVASLASDVNPLQELTERIRRFETKLYNHSDRLMIYMEKPEMFDPSKDPCTEDTTPGEKVEEELKEESTESEEKKLYDELERNSIDSCTFPGFNETRLTILPGNREPAPILDTVTVAQAFKPGFVKFWNKIFQSEASVAVLQDAFWWIFIDRFQPHLLEDRGHLFDRIADSFVALVNSIHLELRDKFLVVYADCLAQALFVSFFRSFPASLHQFDEDFKEYLLHVTHEWVTGGLPPAGRSAKWSKTLQEEGKGQEMSSMSEGPCGFDISTLSAVVHGHSTAGMAGGMEMRAAKFKEFMAAMPVDLYDDDRNRLLTIPDRRSSRLRFAELARADASDCQQQRKQPLVVDEGRVKERVLFNMKAQSPLVSHYLKLLGLRAAAAAGGRHGRSHKVPRTHIIRQPTPPTKY